MSLRLHRFPYSPLWQATSDLARDADLIRRRRYGMIEIQDGRLARIVFRPWPKMISLPEVWWLGGGYHERATGDRCRLYFNQPRSVSQYLALLYAVSSRAASYATIRCAAQVLDEVARIKRSDAIVCEVSNLRISARLLARWGWERHLQDSSHRHYIKRFYGSYGPALLAQGNRITTSAIRCVRTQRKTVGAICCGQAVLAQHGVLDGKPGAGGEKLAANFPYEVPGGPRWTNAAVEIAGEGRIVTASDDKYAEPFADAVVRSLGR